MKSRYLLAAAALTGLVTGCATPKEQACKKAGNQTTCCPAKKSSSSCSAKGNCSAKSGCGGSSGCGAKKSSN